jgi:hypothetical protein
MDVCSPIIYICCYCIATWSAASNYVETLQFLFSLKPVDNRTEQFLLSGHFLQQGWLHCGRLLTFWYYSEQLLVLGDGGISAACVMLLTSRKAFRALYLLQSTTAPFHRIGVRILLGTALKTQTLLKKLFFFLNFRKRMYASHLVHWLTATVYVTGSLLIAYLSLRIRDYALKLQFNIACLWKL